VVAGPDEPTFPMLTIANAQACRALDLLDAITPYPVA